MISPPTREDVKIIGQNLGKIGNIIGVLLLVPIIVAIICGEYDMVPHFIIAASIAFISSNIILYFSRTEKEMELKHAMCVAALAWIFAMLLSAVPLWTTGATGSYLDANFDAMSGFTTTGLTLVTDIDHLPYSVNFYRHFLQFVGGVGIIVITLMVLAKSEVGFVSVFRSEAREEGIRPSIVRTSRIILGIALTFVILGTILFAVVGVWEGAGIGTSISDGLNYSMAAFSTGGFAPHSQSVLFYHSGGYEVVAMIIFLIGSFNFVFHYVVLGGRRREVIKNIEIRTIFITLMISTFVIAISLLSSNVYSSSPVLFRKAFFQAVSAHTTTGFGTVYPAQISGEWPSVAIFAMATIMLLGACANSTGGGIKAIRVGMIAKTFIREVKRIFLPKSAVVKEKVHHVNDIPITDTIARGAALIMISYIVLFFIGTTITMAHGYNAADSMYETSSAVGNVGLSSGITSPAMPDTLKVTYIFLMWVGRLEVMAVLALIGFVILGIKRGLKR